LLLLLLLMMMMMIMMVWLVLLQSLIPSTAPLPKACPSETMTWTILVHRLCFTASLAIAFAIALAAVVFCWASATIRSFAKLFLRVLAWPPLERFPLQPLPCHAI
jgi:hypothetical protein